MKHPLENKVKRRTTSWHWKNLVEEGGEVFEYPFKHKPSKDIFAVFFTLFWCFLGFLGILDVFEKQRFQAVPFLIIGTAYIHSYIYYRINKMLFFKTNIILRKLNFKYRIVDLKDLEEITSLRLFTIGYANIKVRTKEGKSILIPPCLFGVSPVEIKAFKNFVGEISNR